MMVDMAPGRVLSPIGGGTPKGSQKSKILAVKNEYLENGKSQRTSIAKTVVKMVITRDDPVVIDQLFVVHHVHSTPPLIFIARQHTDARY